MRTVLTGLTLALVTVASQAQDLNHLQALRASSDGDHIQLVFEADKPPVFALYQRANPDRLVVELAECEIASGAHAGPLPRGATEWRLKQSDMSHAQACLGLRYRLPASQIKSRVAGNQLLVDLDLSYTQEDSFTLTPGIRWLRKEVVDATSYVLYNELSFDPADPKVHIDVGLAKDRLDAREKPTAQVLRHQAVAGVNGGYFATGGGPLGLVVKDGKVLAPQVDSRPPRTVLGVMKDRKIEFDQVVAKGGTLSSRSGGNWTEAQLALGAGPRLLHRGQVALTTDAEELGPRGNDITRSTARTAVATTREGRMLVATATGYHDNHLQGVRLEEMASMLLRRGASEAMNLDGGSSTTMAIGSRVVSNGPAAGNLEKAVATTLLISDDRPPSYPSNLRLSLANPRLLADGSSTDGLTVEVLDQNGRAVPDGTPVHLFADQVALSETLLKTKGGRATTNLVSLRHPGAAHVRAEAGGAQGEAAVKLEAGSAARLLARVTPPLVIRSDAPVQVRSTPPPASEPQASPAPSPSDPSSPSENPTPAPSPEGSEPAVAPSPGPTPIPQPPPPAYQRPSAQQVAVTMQVTDAWGNPIMGIPVKLLSEKGEELHAGVSGANGQSTGILQLPTAGARLQMTAEGLAPSWVTVPPALSTQGFRPRLSRSPAAAGNPLDTGLAGLRSF